MPTSALVGPAVVGVTDDPEGAEVYAECLAAWKELPAYARRRVTLVTLPMADVDENAAMVNAIQRHATVIVQKSLEEGFGLTVAEGMWKAKAVVASSVGGITEQVVPGDGHPSQRPGGSDRFREGARPNSLHTPGEIGPTRLTCSGACPREFRGRQALASVRPADGRTVRVGEWRRTRSDSHGGTATPRVSCQTCQVRSETQHGSCSRPGEVRPR